RGAFLRGDRGGHGLPRGDRALAHLQSARGHRPPPAGGVRGWPGTCGGARMNEELDSQLSAMFDDELAPAECELLARRLSRDEQLKARWGRYAVIGTAIRSERGVLDAALAGRVSAVILAEPALAAAQGARRAPARWWQPLAGAAVAVGVAVGPVLWLRAQAPRTAAPASERFIALTLAWTVAGAALAGEASPERTPAGETSPESTPAQKTSLDQAPAHKTSLDQAPAHWLERMNRALTTRNYDGTFSHWHGGQVEMLRIIHRVQDGTVSERLASLDGSGREFIRAGPSLTCYLPDKRTVLVEQRPPQ